MSKLIGSESFKDPELRRRCKELEKRLECQTSEIRQESLCIAQDTIDKFKRELNHINTHYSGIQREYELKQFREYLFGYFFDISAFNSGVNEEYIKIIKNEFLNLYKVE